MLQLAARGAAATDETRHPSLRQGTDHQLDRAVAADGRKRVVKRNVQPPAARQGELAHAVRKTARAFHDAVVRLFSRLSAEGFRRRDAHGAKLRVDAAVGEVLHDPVRVGEAARGEVVVDDQAVRDELGRPLALAKEDKRRIVDPEPLPLASLAVGKGDRDGVVAGTEVLHRHIHPTQVSGALADELGGDLERAVPVDADFDLLLGVDVAGEQFQDRLLHAGNVIGREVQRGRVAVLRLAQVHRESARGRDALGNERRHLHLLLLRDQRLGYDQHKRRIENRVTAGRSGEVVGEDELELVVPLPQRRHGDEELAEVSRALAEDRALDLDARFAVQGDPGFLGLVNVVHVHLEPRLADLLGVHGHVEAHDVSGADVFSVEVEGHFVLRRCAHRGQRVGLRDAGTHLRRRSEIAHQLPGRQRLAVDPQRRHLTDEAVDHAARRRAGADPETNRVLAGHPVHHVLEKRSLCRVALGLLLRERLSVAVEASFAVAHHQRDLVHLRVERPGPVAAVNLHRVRRGRRLVTQITEKRLGIGVAGRVVPEAEGHVHHVPADACAAQKRRPVALSLRAHEELDRTVLVKRDQAIVERDMNPRSPFEDERAQVVEGLSGTCDDVVVATLRGDPVVHVLTEGAGGSDDPVDSVAGEVLYVPP